MEERTGGLKLIDHDHLLALRIVLVLAHVLPLFHEIFLNYFDLNELIALPVTCQCGKLIPVLNANRVFIKIRVILAAEVALLSCIILTVVCCETSVVDFFTV